MGTPVRTPCTMHHALQGHALFASIVNSRLDRGRKETSKVLQCGNIGESAIAAARMKVCTWHLFMCCCQGATQRTNSRWVQPLAELAEIGRRREANTCQFRFGTQSQQINGRLKAPESVASSRHCCIRYGNYIQCTVSDSS